MTEAPTPASQEPVEPVLLPPQGLVATTLLLLALTAGVAVAFAPPVKASTLPSLALTTWLPPDEDLASMRQRDEALLRQVERAHGPALQAAEAQIRPKLLEVLRREAELGLDVASAQPASRLARGEVEEALRVLAAAGGSDAVRALAVRYGRDVRQAVERALAAKGANWQDDASVAALAPGLGRTLAPAGLPRWQRGAILHPAMAIVVEALAAQRVFELSGRVPQAPELPSDVQALLLRFRIEVHEGLATERKLQLLSQAAAADPAYPADYVAAVLLARDGRCDEAVPRFRRAARLGQRTQQALANARWCAEQR